MTNWKTVLLPSESRTGSVDSPSQVNKEGQGAHIIIDVTDYPAAASITPTIQGKDPASGKYYTILESKPIVALGLTRLTIRPGVTAIEKVSANDQLPVDWRVHVEHADGDAITYSVGANVMS